MKDLFQENTFVDNITKYIDTNKKSKEKKKKDFAKTLEDLSKKYLVVKKTKEQEEEETLNRFVEGFMELAKTKTPLTEKEVYDNPNCQEMMKQAGADYAPYFQKIIEALEAKKPSVDDITKNNIDTITKTLTAIINEGADNITVFNPDDDETKKADDADTNKQKAKDNVDENIDKEHIIIRDLNNSVDPHYMLALKNKIEAMKPGEEIILATNQ